MAEKMKEEKLVDTDRKLYIPNWNKHPGSMTVNQLRCALNFYFCSVSTTKGVSEMP